MFAFNGSEVSAAKKQGVLQAQESAAQKLIELENLISKCTQRNKALEEEKEVISREPNADWTKSYSFWSKWEDIEELNVKKAAVEENYSNLMMRPDFMGHYHDHSQERNIFYLPEREKLEHCEKYRKRGNILFYEELYPKAAEQYQIALSYYEYCFPEVEEEQELLDSIKLNCLCNISLCYLRIGNYKQAEESADRAIRENGISSKAYFRRAQAFRAQDKFDEAAGDLRKAGELSPNDPAIKVELSLVAQQRQLSLKLETEIAKRAFSPCASEAQPELPESNKLLSIFGSSTAVTDIDWIPSRWNVILDVNATIEPISDDSIESSLINLLLG